MTGIFLAELEYERACGLTPVCGLDEAGRGPLAGPVVAAAVVLDAGAVPAGLNDSKKIPGPRRVELCAEIHGCAHVGVGIADVAEIDEINILNATWLAMCRAVEALPRAPRHALVDGNRLPKGLACSGEALVGGDARCASIAAASIVAKVTRDEIMVALAQQHPGYGWETNAGYGVPAHMAALQTLGVTPHHRRSFAPVHKILCQEDIVSP